jgi:hypothetical protein
MAGARGGLARPSIPYEAYEIEIPLCTLDSPLAWSGEFLLSRFFYFVCTFLPQWGFLILDFTYILKASDNILLGSFLGPGLA